MNKKILVVVLGVVLICLTCMLLNMQQQDVKSDNQQHDVVVTEIDSEKPVEQLVDETKDTTSESDDAKDELVYLGEFTVSHYCTEPIEHICGTGNGETSTGADITVGRTIAVDPSIIPYGTEVYIEGYGYRIAEDCGAAIKQYRIDVAVSTHSEALELGMKTCDVWAVVEK